MTQPIIVVTAGRQNMHTPQREVQTVTVGCDLDYLTAITRAGGAPVLLPLVADATAVRAVLQAADAVVLSGGGDILSLHYGEEPHPKSALHDPLRDAMEFQVAQTALELGLPVLGICRGLQLINVALGGTLYQDLPSQVPEAVKHFSEGLAPVLLHSIDIEEGTTLARIMGAGSMAVNSWHHQAVKDPGHGLRINARARDGVVEGIEAADGRPVLGIQCHPEECVDLYPHFLRLFDWLVAEATARKAAFHAA